MAEFLQISHIYKFGDKTNTSFLTIFKSVCGVLKAVAILLLLLLLLLHSFLVINHTEDAVWRVFVVLTLAFSHHILYMYKGDAIMYMCVQFAIQSVFSWIRHCVHLYCQSSNSSYFYLLGLQLPLLNSLCHVISGLYCGRKAINKLIILKIKFSLIQHGHK